MRAFGGSAQWTFPAPAIVANMPMFEIRAAPTCAPVITGFCLKPTCYSTAGGAASIAIGMAIDSQTGTPIDAQAIGSDDPTVLNATSYGFTVSTRWSKNPTAPATYQRRLILLGSNANQFHNQPTYYHFPRGFSIAGGKSLVFWSLSGNFGTNLNMLIVELREITADI